jgi:hypothetical protein
MPRLPDRSPSRQAVQQSNARRDRPLSGRQFRCAYAGDWPAGVRCSSHLAWRRTPIVGERTRRSRAEVGLTPGGVECPVIGSRREGSLTLAVCHTPFGITSKRPAPRAASVRPSERSRTNVALPSSMKRISSHNSSEGRSYRLPSWSLRPNSSALIGRRFGRCHFPGMLG